MEAENKKQQSALSPAPDADSASPLHLLFTSFIVGVMGFATWMSITNPFEAVKVESKIASQAQVGARAPASEASTVKKQNVIEVFCGRSGQLIETSQSQVRLKLKGCKTGKREIAVSNLTNGFTASVFQEKSAITTDYIDLVSGENNLRIQSQDKKSALSETDLKVVFSLTQNK